jgi:hypothetical protein
VLFAAIVSGVVVTPASAATPVPIPGWNSTSEHAEAIDAAGRAVVAFPHGEHAWAVSISPDGTLSGLGRIEAPRAIDGPTHLTAALNDKGDALVGYTSYAGQAKAGGSDSLGGYGFVMRPWASRFAWGRAPSPARLVSAKGPIRIDQTFTALTPDGTAVFSYTQDDIAHEDGRPTTWLARAAPNAKVTRARITGTGAATGLTARTDGHVAASWYGSAHAPAIGILAPGATTPRVNRGRVGGPKLGPSARVLFDPHGGAVLVWQGDDSGRLRPTTPIDVAGRPAGGARFGPVARAGGDGDTLVDAAVGPGGHAAVLIARGRKTALLVRRTPDGTLLPPIALPGETSIDDIGGAQTPTHQVTVAADGSVVVAYDLIGTGSASAARVVRVAPDGTVVVLSDTPDCGPLGIAGNAAGAAVLALACRTGAKSGTGGAGVVQMIAPAATASASRAATRALASGRGVANLTAFGGHLIFSRRDDKTRRWSLYDLHGGRAHHLHVPSRAVPFDADAGPGPDGRPVLVYSSCAKDPKNALDWLKASGCGIQRLDLSTINATGTRVPGTGVPGFSDTTPSTWRGRLAFARHQDGKSTSQPLLLDTVTPGAQPVPLPAAPSPCQTDCDDIRILTTIESLDLGPASAVAVTRQEGGDTPGIGPAWILQSDALPPAPAKGTIFSTGSIDGACGYVYPRAPAATATGGVAWIAEGSPCEDPETDFASADPTAKAFRIAHVGGLLISAARDGTTTYWLRGDAKAVAGGHAIGPSTCVATRARCTIMKSTSLPYRAVPKGRPVGPTPEDEDDAVTLVPVS